MFPIASKQYIRSGITMQKYTTVKIIIWLWIGCSLATLVTSQQSFYTNGRYGKRQDPGEASSFWSGSRYGRSGNSVEASAAINDEDKSETVAKEVEVSPRIDRFFLGSRYGKRTFSNDHRIDSLKHFETSLDFLISVDHMQTNDNKQQLKVLTQELKDNEDFVALGSRVTDNNYSGLGIKDHGSFSENGFACLYTGVTNLYRCYHRKNNATHGSLN